MKSKLLIACLDAWIKLNKCMHTNYTTSDSITAPLLCVYNLLVSLWTENMIFLSLFYLIAIVCCIGADAENFFTQSSHHINVSSSCQAALNRLSLLAVSEPQMIADYWDSWGKPSHGILKGHTAFLGNYDECVNLKTTIVGDTKFCIYAVKMNVINTRKTANEQDVAVCLTPDCSVERNTTYPVDIKIGVCYTSACSPNEFGNVLSTMDINTVYTINSNNLFSDETNTVSMLLSYVDNSAIFCPQTDIEYDSGTVAVIIMCGVLVGLVAIGTLADIALCSQERPNNSAERHDKDSPNSFHSELKHQKLTIRSFFKAFSLYNTVPTLLSTKQSSSAVKAIAGIKIYSNFLIITLHVFFFFIHYHPSSSQNTMQYLIPLFSRIILQPVFNGSITVDIFFVLSATLSSYLTLRDIKKHGKFRIAHFYLNRYFRLSILCYFYTLIAMKLFVHFGDGPLWYQPDYNGCKKSWWYTLLYLSNSVPVEDGICMEMSWHISVDMKWYIISPVFILPLYYAPCIGLVGMAITMIGATAYVGVVSLSNRFMGAVIVNPDVSKQLITLYTNSVFRANPYLVGILLGYILYRNDANFFHFTKWLKLIMWFTAAFLYSFASFAIYGDHSGMYRFNDFENACYLMFSGLTVSIAISIVIYMCNTGNGGVVNSVLSWPGWEPLVKLSYSVFLVHFMVLYYTFGTMRSSLILTDTVMVMLTAATFVLSYGVSAVVAIIVEIPIANVVSLCFIFIGMEARNK